MTRSDARPGVDSFDGEDSLNTYVNEQGVLCSRAFAEHISPDESPSQQGSVQEGSAPDGPNQVNQVEGTKGPGQRKPSNENSAPAVAPARRKDNPSSSNCKRNGHSLNCVCHVKVCVWS